MENFNQEVDSPRKTWREIEEQRRGNPDLLGGEILVQTNVHRNITLNVSLGSI